MTYNHTIPENIKKSLVDLCIQLQLLYKLQVNIINKDTKYLLPEYSLKFKHIFQQRTLTNFLFHNPSPQSLHIFTKQYIIPNIGSSNGFLELYCNISSNYIDCKIDYYSSSVISGKKIIWTTVISVERGD